ncbi:MAG: GNAT family N-acetyltransferase, partial [Alphaproteobacteria bacterium]|nr:GNAT family N-acetyltransferase [Alphaproteobacteria bacterium]
KAQTRPQGGLEFLSRLLAGNDYSTISGISGWLIQLEKEGQLTSVGFIAYGYYRDTYYGLKYPHQPINFCALSHKRCHEIEWYVNPNYQRRGIASAALDLVIDYCRSVNYTTHHIDYLLAVISPDNALSAQLAQKKHFQALGKDVGTSQHIWSLPINPLLKL